MAKVPSLGQQQARLLVSGKRQADETLEFALAVRGAPPGD